MRTTKKQLQHLTDMVCIYANGTYKLDKNALGYSLHYIGPNGLRARNTLATDCRLTAAEMKYYLMGILNVLQA